MDAATADAASGMKTRTPSPSSLGEITASTRLGKRDSNDDMNDSMLKLARSDTGTCRGMSTAGAPPSSVVTTLAAVADCTSMLKRLERSLTD